MAPGLCWAGVGFGFGSALVWVAALAGAAAAFWVGRFLGLDAVRHLVAHGRTVSLSWPPVAAASRC